MPIDFWCECGQKLRVADHHAGKRAKCPKCQSELLVPATSQKPPDSPEEEEPQWHVQTGDGQQFGPISKTELDEWVTEQRVDDNCQLLQDGWDQWKWASELYPQLAKPVYSSSGNPYAAVGMRGAASHGYQRPHRGQNILIFAILGWVCCPIFSIVAWMQASGDLAAMRAGVMDRSGEGMTKAGMTIAIIALILNALSMVLFFVMFAMGIAIEN